MRAVTIFVLLSTKTLWRFGGKKSQRLVHSNVIKVSQKIKMFIVRIVTENSFLDRLLAVQQVLSVM